MQGPTPWWEQPPDSRDNTVSMPRVDPAEFTDRESSAGPAAPDGRWTAPERPAFGDPYALPAQPGQSRQAPPASGQRPARGPEPENGGTAQPLPDVEAAAPFDAEAGAPFDAEAGAPVDAEAGAPSEPEAAEPPDQAAELPDQEPDVRPEPAVGAPDPAAAALRVEPAATPEPEDGPATWTTPGHEPPAAAAAERTSAAATPEPMGAPVAGSMPSPHSARIAPVTAAQAADQPWRDAETPLRAGSAGVAPPARSAVRPGPEQQAATGMSLGARSWPAGAADRPPAGSIADLRARLARLPAGHPASPYDDTGRSKPAPTRIRMLELGVPARPAGVPSDADWPGLDEDDESADLRPDAAGPTVSPATAALGPSDSLHRSAVGADAETRPPASDGQRARTASQPVTASHPEPASAETPHDTGTAGSTGSATGTGIATPTGAASSDTTDSAASVSDPLPAAADGAPPPRPAATGDSTMRETALRPGDGATTSDRPADGATTSDRRPDGAATSDRRPAGTAATERENGTTTPRPPIANQNGHRGRGASADWQRPYDVPGESGRRSDGPAPLGRTETTGSWPAIDVPPRNGERRNGTRAGQFRDPAQPGSARRQAQRSQPWPTDSDPDEPVARPPAAERASGPVMASRLSPAQRELIDRILTACRAAEGRNAVGRYGNSGLTPAMMRLAAQLPFGGLAPGSEADTLKSADRLAAKLARLVARQPGRSAEQVAASISDAIRYAFTFDPDTYTEGTLLVHRKLKTQGFELEARRNQWDSPEYKGVFTRWRDPAHGLPFEVQFHTGQSWAFVKRTHDAYVRITDPATSPTERARLRAQQATAAEVVHRPPGCEEIADFRAGAREQPR